jgi:SM-20-related protein
MFQTTNLILHFEELAEKKWSVLQLDKAFCLELLSSAQKRLTQNKFHQAELAASKKVESQIRNDQILWLDEQLINISISEKKILNELQFLTNQLKDYFRISLNSFEAHYAFYEKNHFYQRHKDTTSKNNHRIFTFVIYLNHNWTEDDKGEIVGYYDEQKTDKILFTIQPKLGTLLLFQSQLEHEVKPTCVSRFSLTGWFRT